MPSNYIDNLQQKVQKRLERLKQAGRFDIHTSLIQAWNFLHSNPAIKEILLKLETEHQSLSHQADDVINHNRARHLETEAEQVGLSFYIIKKCVEVPLTRSIEAGIGQTYTGGDTEVSLAFFKSFFVDSLFGYIEEQLVKSRIILTILNRYKIRCESFLREELYTLLQSETAKGEKNLCKHLYLWLFDEGVELTIEPSSTSGEIDLIGDQVGDDRLLADGKIFDVKRGVDYLIKAFHQIYKYTLDYDEQFGYLVIFKTCKEDLSFDLPVEPYGIPHYTHNNKTIFFITVDIFPPETSASKSGKLKTYQLSKVQLLEIIKEEAE
jgi:hypothetical protein